MFNFWVQILWKRRISTKIEKKKLELSENEFVINWTKSKDS